MNLKEQITQSLESALEPMLLAVFMVWTLGMTAALFVPQSGAEPQGRVEIYALTAVVDTNTGA